MKTLITTILLLLTATIEPGIITDMDDMSMPEPVEDVVVEEETDAPKVIGSGVLISDLLDNIDEFGLYEFDFGGSAYGGSVGKWEFILFPKRSAKRAFSSEQFLFDYLVNRQDASGGGTNAPHPLPPLKPEFAPNRTPLLSSSDSSQCISCASTVPEPSTLALLCIGGLMISNRRHR
jgi:hypothetical protein